MTTKIRRYDLDWLRVLVFGLLIFYHVARFFGPWDWHIKNNEIYEWLQLPMLFVNQWRLSILFVISGMGTCFALAHRAGKTYLLERLKRLGIPLLFGVLLIVPPQIYFERVASGAFSGSYFQFFIMDAFTTGIYPTGNISWHHLWFLPYLLIYSLVLTPVFLYLRNTPKAPIIQWLKKLIQKPFGIYIFIIPLFLTEAFLEPFFPSTHALIDDWFVFINFLILFGYGFILIRLGAIFWKQMDQIKGLALWIGIIAFATLCGLWQEEDSTCIHFVTAIVKVINCWSWIMVLFGYAAKFLNHQSRILTYCNQAVYPFYILHQTITVAIGFYVMDWGASFWIKFSIMTFGTFFISWVCYELIARINWLRPFFGLKKKSQNNLKNSLMLHN